MVSRLLQTRIIAKASLLANEIAVVVILSHCRIVVFVPLILTVE